MNKFVGVGDMGCWKLKRGVGIRGIGCKGGGWLLKRGKEVGK